MEELKYTEEEKELLELCTYVNGFYEMVLLVPTGDEEIIKNKIKVNDILVSKIIEIAENRRSNSQTIIEREQNKWDTIKDIECNKCKSINPQKPIGEMRNDKNWRIFLYYCPHCKLSEGDYFPIEENDQIKWFDNFIEQSLLVKEDGTTIAEQLSMTQQSIEEMKIIRKSLIDYVNSMKDWEDKIQICYSKYNAYFNSSLIRLKQEKNIIDAIRAKEKAN
jgi:hypothetical protein